MAVKYQWDSRWVAILVTVIVLALGAFWRVEKRFDCIETALAKIECILDVEFVQMAQRRPNDENETQARGDKKVLRP
jgi:hypothetical protein